MKNLVIFIKLNHSAPAVRSAIEYVQSSYTNRIERHYYTSPTDVQIVRDTLASMGRNALDGRCVVFIEYRKTPAVFIRKLYVGEVKRVEEDGDRYKIYYKMESIIDSPIVIDNFMCFSNLNIEKDFPEDSHISIEDSAPLLRQLTYATSCPQNAANRSINYTALPSEEGLSEFAQRNEYCQRLFNALNPSTSRSEYQRDYDRILHSKAFRRMVDKAQIFTSSKGDHYRTRMTHTLCVAQIARSIASRLNMNVPLTEAIALGHDLGHTPFGHQGERTLDKKAKQHGAGAFKHNYQSLNVASVLEEEYIEYSGLDLSVQVLEGIWKHTKIRKERETQLLCNTSDFLPMGVSEDILHPENNFCSTIEGQIVFIADEIAQRSHDLDDALAAGLLTVDGLLETLSLKKLTSLKNQIVQLREAIDTAKQHHRVFISSEELLISRISSRVIDYFIDDVVSCFNNFTDFASVKTYFSENKRVDRQVISFSKEGQILNDYLDKIVKKQVINSPEVAAFDDKAKRIVSSLFDFYYDNPRLLHDGTLQRIYINMRKRSTNVIHFQEADIDLINEEWRRIKNPENAQRIRDIREEFPDIDLTEYETVEEFAKSLDPNGDDMARVNRYVNKCISEYQEKKKILVRAICDFISGMTDTYATNEYRKLVY